MFPTISSRCSKGWTERFVSGEDRLGGQKELILDKEIDYPLALFFIILAGYSGFNVIRASDPYLQIEILSSIPINLMACLAFIVRKPAIEQTNRGEYLIPVLSFVMPFIILNNVIFINPDYSFPLGLLIAIPGMLIALMAIIFIRRSFAVLPAVRTLVDNGPYRYIRHPVYLGEMIYLFGSMLLYFNLLSILCFIAAIAFTIGRIELEERKLGKLPEYREYMKQVKYRLVPRIF